MIYIEILFCLLEAAVQFTELVGQNFIRFRTCSFTLGYNETECALLGTGNHDNRTNELAIATDPYVIQLYMVKDLTDAFISSFMCLFLGAWSDKYGRRPVLICAFAGYALSYTVSTVVVSVSNISPWYMLLSTIPLALSGGFPLLFSSTICYMVDTTSAANKGVRLGAFEVILTIAAFTGTSLSPYALESWGYSGVYLISTNSMYLVLLLTFITIPESIPAPWPLENMPLSDLFNFNLIKESAVATFRRRSHNTRQFLLFVICIIVIYFLAVNSDDKIVWPYLSTKLHWSLKDYALYVTCRKIMWIAGSFIGSFLLHKLLRIREPSLILLGTFSLMVSALMQGVGSESWHIYLGGGLRLFGGMINPMARSLVSKVVGADEVGKVFSFTIVSQTLIVFVGRPIYTYLYNNTLNTMSGAFNFVTVGIYIIQMMLAIYLITLQQRRDNLLNRDNNEAEPLNIPADVF